MNPDIINYTKTISVGISQSD